MSSRSLRRHHRARIKQRVVRYLSRLHEERIEASHRWVQLRVSHGITVCSCPMCCNPRRRKSINWPKETLQERRSEVSLREWLVEVE